MAEIADPTPLNVPPPQDANGTLIPQRVDAGTQSTLSDSDPPSSVPVSVEAPQSYPSALADPELPATPDMPFEAPPALATLTVEPADSSVDNGNTLQFSATASFADNTPSRDVTAEVAWSVSAPSVASFSPDGAGGGLLTGGPGIGAITVFARYRGAVGSTPLLVRPA